MKVNDRVYCIRPTGSILYLQLLKIYEVTKKGLSFFDCDGYFDPAYFYLPSFKKGDKVRCRALPDGKLDPDITYIVKSLLDDTLYVEGINEAFYIWRFVPEYLLACPDCKGSGQYVGFSIIEPCKTCKGKKIIS